MRLSDLNFVETDSEKIMQSFINYFEEYTGESLPTGDVRRQIAQLVTYVATVMSNNINVTGKNNLLRYAIGEWLDLIGEMVGVTRLEAEPSKVKLKFTLSSAQPTEVTIPKGTRATADGSIFFATDADLNIPSGGTSGEVNATATVAGANGNGFVIGQISNIVDGVAYVGEVTNTTVSTDGRDVETDDEMRERIRIAPFSFSTAGAEEAYKYLALTANPNVGDVKPYRASAGNVTIAIVKKDGTLPTAGDEVLSDVENACSAKTARPLTDNVTIAAATAVNDNIDIEYFINAENETEATSIQAKVADAVAEYKIWQTTKIGRDINPDRLRKLVLNAGADSLTINAPTAKAVGEGEVAQFATVNIKYGGITE